MKRIFTIFCAVFLCLLVQGQSIIPAPTSINCPGSTVNFKITIPGGGYQSPVAVGSAISGVGGSQAIQGVSAVTFQSDGTNTYFSFTGRFVAYAAPQGVYLNYVDGGGTSRTTSTFAYCRREAPYRGRSARQILSPLTIPALLPRP